MHLVWRALNRIYSSNKHVSIDTKIETIYWREKIECCECIYGVFDTKCVLPNYKHAIERELLSHVCNTSFFSKFTSTSFCSIWRVRESKEKSALFYESSQFSVAAIVYIITRWNRFFFRSIYRVAVENRRNVSLIRIRIYRPDAHTHVLHSPSIEFKKTSANKFRQRQINRIIDFESKMTLWCIKIQSFLHRKCCLYKQSKKN